MDASQVEADRDLSVGEFERLPEEDAYRVELVRGRLVREPRPGARHGWLMARLGARLQRHVEENHLGLVCMDVGFVLSTDPPSVRGPDIAFLAGDRLPPGELTTGFPRTAPDLAVEIISPSNSASELQRKVLEFLDAGSRLVWVVDPQARIVTAYRSRDEIRVLGESEELEGGDVLPGFRLPLEALFAE